RAAPADDLLTELARKLPTDPETRADAVANCVLFVIAGHATTTSLIAAGTMLLLESGETPSRDQLPGAVEEMLRTITPTTIVVTRAANDDEIVGCQIAAGQHRFVFVAAANRDPDVFPDPDRFDITGTPNPHLSFSAGKHHCLGAPLARLHGEIAIASLLARLPNLRLDGQPEWRGSFSANSNACRSRGTERRAAPSAGAASARRANQARAIRYRYSHTLVQLDRDYTAAQPTDRWEDGYASRLGELLGQSNDRSTPLTETVANGDT